MLKIILETSVLHEDYRLSKAPLIELLNIARIVGASVLMPRMVFDEHVKHFNDTRQEHMKNIESAIKSLKLLPLTNIPAFEITQSQGSYEEFLTTTAAARNIEILALPQVSHAEVFKRCLEKIKPFGSEKDTGYKDTLIWETVLQILRDNPGDKVLFIAKDSDYRKKSTDSLHKHLIEELASLGYNEDDVKLKMSFKSASDYLREENSLGSAELITAVVEQLKVNVAFNEFLTENSHGIESCIEENPEDILRGDPVTDPSLMWNVEDAEIDFQSTEVLETGDVVVYASAEFENEVMYWTFYSSYACDEDSMSEYGISLYEADEDSDSAWVGGSMILNMDFSFVYTPNDNSVSGFEALEIRRVHIEDD